MWKNPKLIDKWSSSLPAQEARAVADVRRLARQHESPLYLVGGPLRDLLLGHPSLDVDLVTEGDAQALAREAAASLDARLKTHPAFGTATIRGDGWHIDLATARSETYQRPGALPDVTPASITEDLGRRDFTINAIALRLDGPDAGALLDPFGGEADLRAGLIRALHDTSFQDDATRILRAARYAARLNFNIEPGTFEWLLRDIGCLNTISGARIHHELLRTFREPAPERPLAWLDETGALAAVHPCLRFGEGAAAALCWLREAHRQSLVTTCWPLLLASTASREEAFAVARRLALTNAQTARLLAMPVLEALLGFLESATLRRSRLADVLSSFPPPAIWAFAALHPGHVRDRLVDYLAHARHLKPVLSGDDIIALGIPQGPEIGEALRRLRAAKLDGEVKTRRDEERFVRSLFTGAPAR